MRAADLLHFATRAASGTPLRTLLMVCAMSIGVAAVVVLTALGDGARRYVMAEFSALGTNLVIVLPGRSETGGFNPANVITNTPRDLTVDDAQALLRDPAVERVAPLTVGNSEAAFSGRLREVMIVGTTASYFRLRQLPLAQGNYLPEDSRVSSAVIGARLRADLFGSEAAVGRMLRVGDRRFRVVGVLAASGQGMGFNVDELVFVPVESAQAMFDSSSLFRIIVEVKSREAIPATRTRVEKTLAARHDGELDFTVITQDAVLATFDKILGALTIAVGGIAAISLAVAGILVMNVMLVSVTQRTGEIGLLKAVGASGRTIRTAFLTEAALLSTAGALVGYALGELGAWSLRLAYPTLPSYPPDWAVIAALATAVGTGLVFGVLPARRAAALDPVNALAKR
jgi:putative ABC transport system permease protein